MFLIPNISEPKEAKKRLQFFIFLLKRIQKQSYQYARTN